MWRAEDPQGDEASKVKFEIVPYTRGKGIDVGCGPHKAFPHFIGIDSLKDTELFGIAMQPDLVCEDATKLAIPDGDLDFVFSSHLLEHIDYFQGALREWWRVLKVGGYLTLYLPHRDLYPNIGTEGANPDHKHDFVPTDIIVSLSDVCDSSSTTGEVIITEVRDQGNEYSFLIVLRKLEQQFTRLNGTMHGVSIKEPYREKPAKTACVVRYAGGIGDMIQASGILPELKRQGYHVTMMTTPRGQDLLREDPNIDAWLIQDNDQVPNHELPAFWDVWEKKFDRFIQLSESVEGTLLAMPGRTNHRWPDNLRRTMLNQNYGEFVARLADIPYRSEAQFYPSDLEQSEAYDYLRKLRNRVARDTNGGKLRPVFAIMWALAGSSLHKAYPHMDNVIANVLAAMPEAVVLFAGDPLCKILEAGWEENPRVRCRSGEATIRQDLALAQRVDCVVGPETGILNAVAFEPCAKVLMLSHSSRENLPKHWVNAHVMEPWDTPCFPCHRLHYGWEYCHEDKATGTAACQVDIDPRQVFEAIATAYGQWKEKQP